MNEYPPLDERYLTWLYDFIDPSPDRSPTHTYWKLCEQLYKTEFLWFVPNDDNRVEDARELRVHYLSDIGESDPAWVDLPSSVLEMLIGVAHRAAFETDEVPGFWFWKLIDHLGLIRFTDAEWSPRQAREVRRTTDRLIHRTYQPDGSGGLFPLRNPNRDQRTVEIWYQMSAYVLEHMP